MKTRPILTRFMIASCIALGLPHSVEAFPMKAETNGCGVPPRMMGERGMPGENQFPPFLQGLELNEAQRDKIFDLMHAQAPAMRDQAKAIHQSQTELRKIGMSAEYSEAKAKALAEANAQAMAKMAQMRASTEHQIYQILTPKQRRQVEEHKMRPQRMEMP